MKVFPRLAKDWRDEVLTALNDIAIRIERAKLKAGRAKSNRCLVELESASMMTAQLIKQVSSLPKRKRVNWSAMVDAVALISKVLEKFNAFLIYQIGSCLINEDWFVDQALTSDRGDFANYACGRIGGSSHLPFSNRE